MQVILEENKNKLERFERERVSAGDGKKAIERELNNIKQDQADAQAKVQKSKQEKDKLEVILRGLNEEVVHQDEIITKANKEKKHMTDTMSKATEEMNVNQEKLDYLNGIKAKLEKTLDQMDSAVESEKRSKANSEKDKRRLEGDLRGMQQELDNFMSQIKNSEEKTKKAMADAGRLADELRCDYYYDCIYKETFVKKITK